MIGGLRLMLNHLNPSRVRLSRLLLPVFVISLLLLNTGCGLFGAKRKIEVPPLLTPIVKADKNQLIQEVNRLSTVKSIHGKVDIQFEDTSFASSGIADQYRLVDGTITLQRPGQIYLIIQFTFVDIAQMTSDGEHFRVAVLKGDDRYKRFVKGTNDAHYEPLRTSGTITNKENKTKGAERETVHALSNLRPQHLTDALLIEPIDAHNGGLIYSQSEFYEEEPDKRPQAKSGVRIVRGYYLLEELATTASGEARLKRRFWFDRVEGIRLARLQTFDDQGLLDTDVSYSDYQTLGQGPTAQLAGHIELTRPRDQYKLNLTYQDPVSVTIDRGWPANVF